MQFLIFHLDQDRYAMATMGIARVLPLMKLKSLPRAPSYVAGLMNLHGKTVPVIDLCQLSCGRPHTLRFDTRIVLINHAGRDGHAHLLGLIAEKVEGIAFLDMAQLADSGIANEGAPYLGKVCTHAGRIVQIITPEHLLADDVRRVLFAENGGAAS